MPRIYQDGQRLTTISSMKCLDFKGSFSRELWNMILALFGVQWVMPCTVLDLLACWQGSFGKHRHVELWRCIPHCLMWCIWRERNMRSFEGVEQTLLSLKNNFLKTLFEWAGVSGCLPCESFLDFLDICSLRV
jgi:hypothetical protein